MERKSKINVVVICALLVTIVMMSVGYAAMSQALNIRGTATVKSAASSWNVHFSNVSTDHENDGSFSSDVEITTDTAKGATGTNNLIEFGCILTAPGDSCTVTAKVVNTGTITAVYKGQVFKVDGTTITGNQTTTSTGVVVTVTPEATWTADTTELTSSSAEGTFVIKMELPSTVETLPESSDVEHSVSLELDFAQKTAN